MSASWANQNETVPPASIRVIGRCPLFRANKFSAILDFRLFCLESNWWKLSFVFHRALFSCVTLATYSFISSLFLIVWRKSWRGLGYSIFFLGVWLTKNVTVVVKFDILQRNNADEGKIQIIIHRWSKSFTLALQSWSGTIIALRHVFGQSILPVYQSSPISFCAS